MQLLTAASGLAAVVFLAEAAVAQQNVKQASDCSCGFRDPSTKRVFTESIIIYYNETTTFQNDSLQILDYHHKKEKGWNTIYRQGSSPSNVIIGDQDTLPWQEAIDGNSSSLEAYLDPSNHHLIVGAHLQSVRQDMLYGTFRASMRSPQPWVGGSAWTFGLNFNESNRLQMDMLNQNIPTTAKIEQLVNGESPDNSRAINYTTLQAGTEGVPPIAPWDFVNMRFDWAKDNVDFWIGSNKTRSITKDDRTLPTVPQPLYFRHWCTGDMNYMQGPPVNRSVANLRFVRAFFNSSIMTEAQHNDFDKRCNVNSTCSIDDHSLRGSTSYPAAATQAYEEPVHDRQLRIGAAIVAGVFSTFGVATLINAFFRRTPWHKLKKLRIVDKQERQNKKLKDTLRASVAQPTDDKHKQPMSDEKQGLEPYSQGASANPSVTFLPEYTSRMPTPQSLAPTYQTVNKNRMSWPLSVQDPRSASSLSSGTQATQDRMHMRYTPSPGLTDPQTDARLTPSPGFPVTPNRWSRISQMTTDSQMTSDSQYTDATTDDESRVDESGRSKRWSRLSYMTTDSQMTTDSAGEETEAREEPETIDQNISVFPLDTQSPQQLENNTTLHDIVQSTVHPHANVVPAVIAPKQRIDYLAGFVALSCIAVTLRHFSLTFWPYVTEDAGDNKHFSADTWLSYVLGPYLLTPLWIGPFFVTSCRFLTGRYLKNGKLEDVANKVLLRGARMLIPCYVFVTLEYFFLEMGITGMLEWLPSVSYSVWPYVNPQPNFGVFINELVELTYLIPNASPEIINHYCIGILWTIPVQHYYSYVTLLAAVMIRPVKTPWKRFAFYFLALVTSWYAVSWSACHWAGLALADLDITYNWVKWAQSKWYRLYPILTIAALIAGATPLVLLFNTSFYNYPFMSYEAAIHPDPTTGRPVLGVIPTVFDAYPNYYVPNLAILCFAVSLQVVVELSTVVQWILSLKCFVLLHPHIMTIYLMHGIVFWSLGSFLAVTFKTAGLPYSVVLLLVAACCYTVILSLAFILSPLIEFTTQAAMRHLWRWATEEPVPHRSTVAPFTKGLIIDRQAEEQKEPGDVKV